MRNSYAILLLYYLEKKQLEEPFRKKPVDRNLPKLTLDLLVILTMRQYHIFLREE